MQRIIAFLEKYKILNSEKTFLVGFSGGYDSMCLLDILNDLSKKNNFKIIAVHLNHNWRGEESDNEEQNCKEFCKQRNINFYSERLSDKVKKTETAAREARQKFFKKCCENLKQQVSFLHITNQTTQKL